MASICGSPVCAGGKPKLKFTYTGDYVVRKDGVVELHSSGTLVFIDPAVIDIFCVGGGGAGGIALAATGNNVTCAAGGGGGGLTATRKNVSVTGAFDVTIGAGATTTSTTSAEKYGGTTSFGNLLSARGGISAITTAPGYAHFSSKGADGGSGGGGGVVSNSDYGTGGFDGNNGESGYPTSTSGGAGQGYTTREFGEASGKLYAGGGGGGRYMVSPTPVVSMGGTGGGGAGSWTGGSTSAIQPASAGVANTGGGGGGNSWRKTSGGSSWGAENASGGSGIVCFRDAAELPELAGTWVLNEKLYPSQTGESINEVISYQGVTPHGNFTGYSIGIGATATSTVAFYLNTSTIYAQYQFSNNQWIISKPYPVQTITFPAGATASAEFRAWLASNATKQA